MNTEYDLNQKTLLYFVRNSPKSIQVKMYCFALGSIYSFLGLIIITTISLKELIATDKTMSS